MKISIIGGGNMGGAIASGLLAANAISPKDLTIIEKKDIKLKNLMSLYPEMNIDLNSYKSLKDANIVIIAVKPWVVEEALSAIKNILEPDSQILVSIAGGVSIAQLQEWTNKTKTIFRVMPNTAISVIQSMTFLTSVNATEEQNKLLAGLFGRLGKVENVSEDLFPAVTSLASCGIAYAFRYIRAAMEGGVEMGVYPDKSKDIVLQTLRGAIDLLEKNGSHPEVEIDKVTTAGGTTIKGLNEMEHSGFTSSVIKGLKASKE